MPFYELDGLVIPRGDCHWLSLNVSYNKETKIEPI